MNQPEEIMHGLEVGAAELAREIARLPEEAALWRPGEGEWSQHEALTHIWIAEHYVFLPRITAMAQQDNPFLPVVDETALQRSEWRAEQPRAELLAAFQADRQAELALLAASDWDRPGVHETNGPISIGWVAAYAMGHTWEHLSQMLRVRLRHALRRAA
ncbi:MAG: DinB family protein [Anaerolineales bacterium]